MKGFYAETTWQKPQPLSFIAECGKCKLFKNCHSPYMPVTGEGKKKILVVGEAPGETEDKKNIQFIGSSGFELVRLFNRLGVNLRKDCWLTNAVICRPTDENGANRKPETKEINFCRPNLIKTLRELKPNLIVTLGEVALRSLIPLAWKDGEVSDMGTWAGWQIPSQKLNTWICPTYHPAFLLRQKSSVVELVMLKHLKAAFTHNTKPWPTLPDLDSKLKLIYNDREADHAIRQLTQNAKSLAFDYETDRLKPDHPDARILSCSISDGVTSIAYPWLKLAKEATSEMIRSKTPKILYNAKFEYRWTKKALGHGITNWRNGWDGMIGAHLLNCHHGVTSLKFQSFVRLGMPDYDSFLDKYKDGENGNAPNTLSKVELPMLLKYGALDALLTMLIAQKQQEEMYGNLETSSGI